MIYNSIDKLIAEAMKSKDEVRLQTLRLIKTKFLEYKTSKGAKPIDNNIEIQILNKMAIERKDAINIYKQAGREDLMIKEENELNIIKEFLPKEVTIEEIEAEFNIIKKTGVTTERKNMGVFIKKIKEKYPNVNGKLLADFVSKKLS